MFSKMKKENTRYKARRKILEIGTFNRLWREEIMHCRLHSWIWCDVFDSLRQFLKNHSALQRWESLPQLQNLTAEGSADVDEKYVVLAVTSFG